MSKGYLYFDGTGPNEIDEKTAAQSAAESLIRLQARVDDLCRGKGEWGDSELLARIQREMEEVERLKADKTGYEHGKLVGRLGALRWVARLMGWTDAPSNEPGVTP
jgi:uncharacterized small protein (DUF1192 family)